MDELSRLAVDAGGGDRVARDAFVRATHADVWRLCRHLGDPETADDLTQEVYVRALRALPAFRGDAPARSWLLAIARRTCADEVRARTRRRRLLERVAPESVEGAAPAGEVELDLLVAGLPPDRREAFVLTQVLGLRYDEAAAVCRCPVGTIRSRVARARAELVAALSTDAPPSSGG